MAEKEVARLTMVDLSGMPAFFPAESSPENDVTWHVGEIFIPNPAGPLGTGQSIGMAAC